MKKLGWILIFTLCLAWAYLDLVGTKPPPIVEKIINQDNKKTLEAQPQTVIEAGYVPGKSPNAQKAEDHIRLSLRSLPEDGPISIISKKILVYPRPDGTWTEEWLVEKGKTQIPIKIEFGVDNFK